MMKKLLLLCFMAMSLYAAESTEQYEFEEPDMQTRQGRVERIRRGYEKHGDLSSGNVRRNNVGTDGGHLVVDVAERGGNSSSEGGLVVPGEKDVYSEAFDRLYKKQVGDFESSPTSMIFARAASWSIGSARHVIDAKEEDINGMRFPILADEPFVTPELQAAYESLKSAFDIFEQASMASYDGATGRVMARSNAELVAEKHVEMMSHYAKVLDKIYRSASGLDSSSRDFVKTVRKWIADGQYEKATTASPELLKILSASGSKGGSLILSQMMMMDVTLSRAVNELNAQVDPAEAMVEDQLAEYQRMDSKEVYSLFEEKDGSPSVVEIGQEDDLEELLASVEADKSLVEQKRFFGRASSGRSDSMYNALLKGARMLVDVGSRRYEEAGYRELRAGRQMIEAERRVMLQEYVHALEYLAKKSGRSSKFKNYIRDVRNRIEFGSYHDIMDYQSDIVREMLQKSSSKKASLIVAQMRTVAKSMDNAIDDLRSMERVKKPRSQKERIEHALFNRDRYLYDERAIAPPSPAGGYSSAGHQAGDVSISKDQFGR